MSPLLPFAAGDVIDSKYRVDEVLGVGGMGVVYAASHVALATSVAIKALLPRFRNNAMVRERFVREARAVASLKSDNVTRIHDVGTDANGNPYIVMERLVGSDLEQLLAQRGMLDERVAVDYVIQACVSLAEAHARGIVHRDLKLENLFLTRARHGRDLVKVLDFGISKSADEGKGLTATTDVMGTPHFMAPEQIRSAKDVCPASDVWALGGILYRLLTNTLPFDGTSLPQLCARIMFEVQVPLEQRRPELTPEICAIVRRCLEKDPAHRFANAAELGHALRQAASIPRVITPRANDHVCVYGATQVVAPVVLPEPRATQHARRSRLPLVAIAILALTCFAGWTQRSVAMPRHTPPEVVATESPAPLEAAPSLLPLTSAQAATKAMPTPAKPSRRARK